ncbi:type II/IV secretion system protein [Candidatus Sumerlaeota bacterium]|nr:type II/IV secretion system protein [Candidatus Sumerlaeota bacterium]
MIKIKQKTRSQVIVVFLFVFGAGLCFADRIYKKDGTVVEGAILSFTNDKYVIEAVPSRVKIEIKAEEVEKVEKGLSGDIPERLRKEYETAEKAVREGNPFEGVQKLIDLGKSSESFPGVFWNTLSLGLEKCLGQADEKAASPEFREESIRLYEWIKNIAIQEPSKGMIQRLPQGKDLVSGLDLKIASACYMKAIDDTQKNDPGLFQGIEQNLQKALDLTPGTDPRYNRILEALGIFKMNYSKKFDDAIALFQKAYEESTDDAIRNRWYDLLNQAKDAKIQDARKDGSFTPVPSPTPALMEPVYVTVPPTIELKNPPKSEIKREEIPLKQQIIQRWKNKRYKDAARLSWKLIRESGVLPLIGIGFVALFFLWFIPFVIIRWRARRVDLLAAKFLPVVRFTGIIGLLIYLLIAMIQFIFKKTHKGDICPYCKKRIDNIESYSDYNFRICPHCHENIVPLYSLEDYIMHLVDNVQKNIQKRAGYKVDTNLVEKDAMLKLIRAIITLAFRKRASDLHIEPDNEGLKIRARIDGMLYEIMNLPRQVGDSIISAIKVMSNLDISEKRIPQDGRISIWVDTKDLDLRISASPIAQGEKISMRILDPTEILVDSTRLGLDGKNLENFERAIRKPYGLILVTGTSGSGKSTTLYVALHTVNTGDKNIVTIEDPVEYKLEGISQQQVHVEANFTFATGLRSILRQDPDIIMVGEIRDKDTADIAIDAATTGHLVLTTLHTIDTANAFGRLTDLGVSSRRYAPILISIIAQRLIRLNCPNCKKLYTPKKSDLEMLNVGDNMGIVFMKGMGCENCNNSGFYGRTGIFEMLLPDDEMKKLLETNPAVSVIGALARNKGMKTLKEEGILKINRGMTTVEEVLRVTM